MWKRFRAWLMTAKAGAITNGVAAVTCGGMAAASESEPVRWLVGFNALLLASTAGIRIADHFNASVTAMREAWIELQNRQLKELMTENDKLYSEVVELRARGAS